MTDLKTLLRQNERLENLIVSSTISAIHKDALLMPLPGDLTSVSKGCLMSSIFELSRFVPFRSRITLL